MRQSVQMVRRPEGGQNQRLARVRLTMRQWELSDPAGAPFLARTHQWQTLARFHAALVRAQPKRDAPQQPANWEWIAHQQDHAKAVRRQQQQQRPQPLWPP
jgi:hypothetical protein